MAEDPVEDREAPDGSYELDLDDTISRLPEVMAQAVAAVDRTGEAELETETELETEDAFAVPEFAVPDLTVPDSPEEDEPEAEDEEEPETEDKESEWDRELAVRNREIEARNEMLDAKVGALRERLTRTLADFDNFRKRTEREQEKLRRYALFDVLGDFLGVFDNLERAAAASGSVEDLKEGVAMIVRQLEDLLRRYGVSPIESLGKPFDPTVHEAVAREEGAQVEEPTVTAELQKGYHLHDRLLRPAMVYVAMPAPQAETAAEAEEREGEVEELDEPDEEVAETEVAD